MTGPNELRLNEATMIEAARYWLNAQFVTDPPVIQSISGSSDSQYDKILMIKMSAAEQEP